jgi:anti-anti-sigma factor
MDGEPVRYSLHQGPLTLHVRHAADGACRVEVGGRIDGATCHALRSVLLAEVEQGPVVLDGSALGHFAAAGVRVVREAAEHAAAHEQSLRVTASSRAVVAAFGASASAPPPGLIEQPATG